MKIIFLSLLFSILPFTSMISQEKGILLQKKDTERTDFLIEHKRIKVVTTDGRSYFGRFSIIDDKTISINNTLIPLISIEKIKKKSLASTIVSPLVCVVGVVFILGGTAVAVIGGSTEAIMGLGLISSGFTIPLIALISNKHPKNQWQYVIGEIQSN